MEWVRFSVNKQAINAKDLDIFYPKQMLNVHVSTTSILIVRTFSKPHLADYPWRNNMDGFLRLTHGFCLQRSSPVQAGPTGTCVYTASQTRLGGPIFTPRCFPKKTSCRGPSPKVHHTENRAYCLIPPVMLRSVAALIILKVSMEHYAISAT